MNRLALDELPLPSSFRNYPSNNNQISDNGRHNTDNSLRSSSDNITDEEGVLGDLEDETEEGYDEESENDRPQQRLNGNEVEDPAEEYPNLNRDRTNSTSTTTQANVMNRARPKKDPERRSSFYRAPQVAATVASARISGTQHPPPIITDFRRSDSPYSRETRGSRFEEDINGPSYSYNNYDGTNSPLNLPPFSAGIRDKPRDRSSFYGVESVNQPQNDRSGALQQRPESGSNSYSSHEQATRYQSQQSSLQPAYSYPSEANLSQSQNQSRRSYPQPNADRLNTSGSMEFSLVANSPATLLDQSHLRPGNLASLLSHEKTLDLYRTNAKKTGDPDVQFEFCTFVMDVVGELEAVERQDRDQGPGTTTSSPGGPASAKTQALIAESMALLSKLAMRGHVKSQYFLADCYTQGVGTQKGKRDFDRAYPLFVLAGKHNHPDACFRAAQCCENGWGCRKDFSKAVTYLRKSAMLGHPPAMHRLGLAEMNAELNLTRRPKEGLKWIRRAAELADQVDPPQPQSLHELAMLNEKGIENVIFIDHEYSAELYARAAELGYSPSAYKLGECYEYGRMGCPQDSALSIHYYNIAAQQNHREACFALTAWYLVGSPGVLPQSDTEAYLWARKAAEMGLAKAEYAVGYFTEVGIGTHKHARDALDWFRKAADHGDKRAKERLRMASLGPSSPGLSSPPPPLPHSKSIPGSPSFRQIQSPGASNYGGKGKGKDVGNNRDGNSSNINSNRNNDGPCYDNVGGDPRALMPRPEYTKLRLDSQGSPAQPSFRQHSQAQSSPASSAAYNDPYGQFYEAPLDTYGRPAPVERLTAQQLREQQDGARSEQLREQQQRRATDPTGLNEKSKGVLQKKNDKGKKGEKGEDCIIC